MGEGGERRGMGSGCLPVLDPTVGAVETTDPRVILYIRVVLPALSSLFIYTERGMMGWYGE